MNNMHNHEFEVRFETETRSVTGIAVPYGETIDLGGFQERIAPGAFDTSKKVPLFFGHEHRSIPIGTVVSMRDTAQGLEINATLNETSMANDVYAALRSGDLNKFSIGFVPLESRDENGVTVRVKADLKEVSVVTFPAYAGAGVSQVREENKNNTKEKEIMTENYSEDVAELRDSVADLARKFDRMKDEGTNDHVGASTCYRTGGEWIKGLLRGETAARDIATRDFGTTVEADVTRPAWVAKSLHIVEKQRIIKGLFSQSPLPSNGMSLEYPHVSSTTGTAAKQSAEGAPLGYLELAVDTKSATVDTFGAYSSLSRQAIERADVNYLDAVLRFQTIAYANATEKAVQDALVATYNATVTASTANEVEIDLTSTSAVVWLGAILDAKAAIDTNSTLGLSADFILISRDIHKKLALIVDTAGRPVFAVNGDGANTLGGLPLNGRLAGVIDGTPVVVGKNLPTGTVIVASAEALVSYESAGAPVRLQDESIINLTKDFSIHGYMAIATPDVKGITFIVDDGA